MKKYKVGGYVKNALLWQWRNPQEMILCNRRYFEQQFDGAEDAELVDVYVDVTGKKETYKRPEMVRLIRDMIDGRINMIYSRTSGYIAADANELCLLLNFLFENIESFDLFTEDPVYQFNTIENPDNQEEELRKMAALYCSFRQKEYSEWKEKLLAKIQELNDEMLGDTKRGI